MACKDVKKLIDDGKREFWNSVREMRMLDQIEKLNLTTTRELINAWRSVVGNGFRTEEEISDFEKLISDWAIEEWGEGSVVIFNRENQTAIVKGKHGYKMGVGV